MKYSLLLFVFIVFSCQGGKYDMETYRGQLDDLRKKCEKYDLKAPQFFLFGMGNREKFVYKNYKLISIDDNSIVYSFEEAVSDSIIPNEYKVIINTQKGKKTIFEDEDGIWLQNSDKRDSIHINYCHVTLPDFRGKVYSQVLKVLHHEILINIKDSRLYPNLFVYKKPFLRDAFMGALCLEQTGNSNILKPWIESIDSVYDMQNGIAEPDNLGELLYLLNFIPADSNKLLKCKIREEIRRQTIVDGNLRYISGYTDGNVNAEYQTQILKFALKKSGIKDNYTSARIPGFYYNLCWFTRGTNKQTLRQFIEYKKYGRRDLPWPYLMWARAHFYDNFQAPMANVDYPLSWEQYGESAIYDGMKIISSDAVDNKVCYPHVWTAAEMFLKLIQYEE